MERTIRSLDAPTVRWTHRPTLGRTDQDRAQRAGYLRLASGLMYGKALLAGTGERQRPLVLPGLQWVERATSVLPLAEEDGAVCAYGSARRTGRNYSYEPGPPPARANDRPTRTPAPPLGATR